MLFATSNCHAGFWRTMPDIVMDEHRFGIKSEAIDTDQEDHCSDDVMYAAMSRPWMRHVEKKERPQRDWFAKSDKPQAESWKTV
jgi:hypothetical protein